MNTNYRKTILGLVLCVVCTCVNASKIYDVNLSVGTGSATGSITTDGLFGSLSASDILDWSIKLDGNPGNIFTLLGPLSGNNSQLAVNSSNFVASAGAITFNFSSGGYVLFQNPSLGSGINYLCFASDLCGNFSNAINLGTNVFGVDTSPQTGVQIVATANANVPEPTTIALIGLGFASMAYRRRKSV